MNNCCEFLAGKEGHLEYWESLGAPSGMVKGIVRAAMTIIIGSDDRKFTFDIIVGETGACSTMRDCLTPVSIDQKGWIRTSERAWRSGYFGRS
jgi:hypothetical protein